MRDLGVLIIDLTSGDNQRAETASVELPIHGEKALERLKELPAGQEADTRWWATRALAGFQEPEAGTLLTEQLDDPDASVRYCSALALSRQQHQASITKLINALDSEDNLLVRLAAMPWWLPAPEQWSR